MPHTRFRCLGALLVVAGTVALWSFASNAEDTTTPGKQPTPIRVTSLNSGEYVLIGRLGHPLGSYHVVRATFGMPVPKGRAGNGGRIHLHVLDVDGRKLGEPLWIPYFKGMTLQDYVLPGRHEHVPRSSAHAYAQRKDRRL